MNSRFAESKVLSDGNGTLVFYAYDERHNRHVVIKEAVGDNSQVANEIQFLSVLSHDGIIKPIEVDPSGHFLVLPYAEGGDLLHYIDTLGEPISEDLAKLTFRKILEALVYLENKGVVHGDIKPEQILITGPVYTGDNVVLCDFGLALDASDDKEKIHGTTGYIAPEVYKSYKITHKSDVWALGMTMFVALTMRMPLYSDSESGIQFEVEMGLPGLHNDEFFEGLSEDAVDLIKQMLAEETKRITAAQALQHRWFQSSDTIKNSATIERSGPYGDAFRRDFDTYPSLEL